MTTTETILVVNAGVGAYGPILDLPADQRPKPRSQTEPGPAYFLPENRF